MTKRKSNKKSTPTLDTFIIDHLPECPSVSIRQQIPGIGNYGGLRYRLAIKSTRSSAENRIGFTDSLDTCIKFLRGQKDDEVRRVYDQHHVTGYASRSHIIWEG